MLLVLALAGITVLALRNQVFFRLGIRSLTRRRGRTALIVVGLMLGTTIISAALATGDTMSHTIRSSATAALGQTDEVVGAKGIDAALASENGGGGSTGWKYFPQGYADRLARDTRSSGLIERVEPVIVEPVARSGTRTSRQSEARVTLFPTPNEAGRSRRRLVRERGVPQPEGCGQARTPSRATSSRSSSGDRAATATVRAIVKYDGVGTDGAAVLMPLPAAQQFLGKPGLVQGPVRLEHRRASPARTRRCARSSPQPRRLGLEADNTKQDALEQADAGGAMFMSFFTTFGSFSIAAGILLIFLIFVMLAAERRE